MPPKPMEGGENATRKKSRRRTVPKDSPEYKVRRDRNNVAVKKSRCQTKEKTKQTLERVSQLRNENEQLEQQVKLLAKELVVLKDLFKMSRPDMGTAAGSGMEAGIQTDDDVFGAQGVVDHFKTEAPMEYSHEDTDKKELNFLNTSDIEVNTRALARDHEYFVKDEPDGLN